MADDMMAQIGPARRPDPRQLGVSKRAKMENDFRRRGVMRNFRDIMDKHPRIAQALLRKRTGGMQQNPAQAPGAPGIDQAIGQKYGGGAPRRAGGGVANGAVTGVYPGSPAYYGANWGVDRSAPGQGPGQIAPAPSMPGPGQMAPQGMGIFEPVMNPVQSGPLPDAKDVHSMDQFPSQGHVPQSQVLAVESPESVARRQGQAQSAYNDWWLTKYYPEMKALQARIDSAGMAGPGQVPASVTGLPAPAGPKKSQVANMKSLAPHTEAVNKYQILASQDPETYGPKLNEALASYQAALQGLGTQAPTAAAPAGAPAQAPAQPATRKFDAPGKPDYYSNRTDAELDPAMKAQYPVGLEEAYAAPEVTQAQPEWLEALAGAEPQRTGNQVMERRLKDGTTVKVRKLADGTYLDASGG